MKITAVKVHFLKHALKHGIGVATGYYRARTTLIIKVETDEGICGWGEAPAFTEVRAILEQQYAPLLIGRDPLREGRNLWRELWGPNFGNGMALGGMDMALDDLRGKALGLPVAELYGGRLRDRVEVYVSAPARHIEGEDPAERHPQVAAEMVERGFRAIKIRIGGLPPRQEIPIIASVREAIGPDIKLMADGNGAYTLGSAIEVGRELERLGLYWFEEPLPQNTPEYAAYEVLRDKLDIPIAACEGLTSRGMFKEAIARRAMDIVQPDTNLVGGIGESLFIAEMARLWGIQCMPHCGIGGLSTAACAHLVSLLPDASWSRHTDPPLLELAGMVENPFRDDLLVTPLEISHGCVTVPRRPGLGVEVDEDRLRHYAQP